MFTFMRKNTLLQTYDQLLYRWNFEEAAKLWRKSPVDLDYPFTLEDDDTGRSFRLLNRLIENDNLSGIKFCLERGADPNWCTDTSFSTLYKAISSARIAAALALLEAGANPNLSIRKSLKDFPLHCAANRDSLPFVRMLLEHGAQVNMLDKTGMTPLMWACAMGNIECTKLLLESGAKTQIKDINGLDAKDHAHQSVRPGTGLCEMLVCAHEAKGYALSAMSALADFGLSSSPTGVRPS